MNDFSQYLKRYINLTNEEEAVLALKLKHRKYLKGQYIGITKEFLSTIRSQISKQ